MRRGCYPGAARRSRGNGLLPQPASTPVPPCPSPLTRVLQGGMLDSEAASRCTTVYLVDRRLDMLPALLSEDLCSLRGGQGEPRAACVLLSLANRRRVVGHRQSRAASVARHPCCTRGKPPPPPCCTPGSQAPLPACPPSPCCRADRFAVSVLWTLDADSFEVVDTWYGRTMIRQVWVRGAGPGLPTKGSSAVGFVPMTGGRDGCLVV